ncbi:hypothetical protein GO755_39615 [Spirosoma sp. HMF4905]|uniref:Uncharacterized protein n=1 Tax=Spirosoma arboris TaxID=2682092 RepID=A0A7K1SQY0_9BACT|nr:hypothetical protein [Spirosoma arboris]MVM36187.1 hypothetical protein [Spirosoma arboris]
MEKTTNTFETLLDKYLFRVASAVIDQFDSAHQDKLIHLMLTCNKSRIVSPPLTAEFEHQQTTKHAKKIRNQSVEDSLRAQWQSAVSLPGRGYVAYQQRQLVIYQTHIDLMLHYIAHLGKLLEQATGKEEAQPSELIRLIQYQTLQDRYIVKVAKLRAEQQKVDVQLNLYYESIALETGTSPI